MKRFGKFLIIFGALVILAGVGMTVYNVVDDHNAAQRIETQIAALEEAIENRSQDGEEETPSAGEGLMSEVTVGEYEYIGYLEIPYLDLKLPVMAQWSYDRLQIAPCRYAGTVYGLDLCIAAHNYDKHFGRIASLYEGAEIDFIDVNGAVTRYKVVKGEELEADAVDQMTDSDYPLTLFTCNFDGSARVTVRCELAD